jgi:4-hydroxybutyrate dehydrogenase/sulfolactaldehyde 3-reductase
LKGAMMLKGEYKPSFPLRLMHKDMGLALDLANQLGVPLPAAAATREILSATKGAATEDVDFSAIAEFWQKS